MKKIKINRITQKTYNHPVTSGIARAYYAYKGITQQNVKGNLKVWNPKKYLSYEIQTFNNAEAPTRLRKGFITTDAGVRQMKRELPILKVKAANVIKKIQALVNKR